MVTGAVQLTIHRAEGESAQRFPVILWGTFATVHVRSTQYTTLFRAKALKERFAPLVCTMWLLILLATFKFFYVLHYIKFLQNAL